MSICESKDAEIAMLRGRLDQAEADREAYKEQMIRAQIDLHAFKGDVADEIEKLRAALQFIVDGYARGDVNHVDFRVGAYQAALSVLDAPFAGSEHSEGCPSGDFGPCDCGYALSPQATETSHD